MITAKFTKPVKVYTCVEDAVADSAIPMKGPNMATQPVQITEEKPINVYYTNENGVASDYKNLTFDPASSDHMLNH